MCYKIGDMVKVISKTDDNGEMREYFPIGTICEIVEIGCDDNESYFYGVKPINTFYCGSPYYYLENELEKGHMQWIAD